MTAALASAATLGVSVPVVVADGAEEEVLRADTGSVVAPMQDAQTLGDGAMGQLPGDAVRLGGRVTGVGLHVELPVAGAVEVAGPRPAAFTAGVDLGPKPLSEVACRRARLAQRRERVALAVPGEVVPIAPALAADWAITTIDRAGRLHIADHTGNGSEVES